MCQCWSYTCPLTNNIVIFKRNKATGLLTDTGKKIEIGAPVCFLFVPNK